MFKGARTRERVFAGLMWLVSIVLAGFLIGLGSLVIGDLPKVSEPVRLEQFMDPPRLAAVEGDKVRLEQAADLSRSRLRDAEESLSRAQTAYGAAKETFDNWISTRAATGDRAQDPEVIARTRELDGLRTTERDAQSRRDAVQTNLDALGRSLAANQSARESLQDAARPRFEKASFLQELKVFGLRLALTLPLLVMSAWLLFQRPRGDYWPMKRGFILFSAFAFFVELVPYLPEYGGYVRYGVGILLTLVVGHYVIKGMRAYLATREADESRAEPERVKSIAYDEALKKMAARTCPGCERTLPPVDGAPIDYCVHCGMHLFNHCAHCDARKFAFFRFCMACGTPATPDIANRGLDATSAPAPT